MTVNRIKAFTLVEVMFAVITLGIGLIMVAAIFPVAIQQRKLAGEETTAANSGQAGVQVLADLGKQGAGLVFPPTGIATTPYPGTVQPLPATLWNAIRGNLILASDPRMAWVPLYRRTGSGNLGVEDTAQVFVIGVQMRNATLFEERFDTVAVTPRLYANLYPRAGRVKIDKITGPGNDLYYADFDGMNGAGATIVNNINALAEGMFVIIADDEITNATPANMGRMNGRIYRLGPPRTDLGALVYELAPGWDFKPDPGADGFLHPTFGGTGGPSTDDIVNIGGGASSPSLTTSSAPDGVPCWFVGRGFVDPNNQTPATAQPVFDGGAMDVSVFTAFIPLAN